MASWIILGFFILLLVTYGYYYFVQKSKRNNGSNIIQLQTDGFDFIVYKGKITEMATEDKKFLGNLDIVVYSKSVFIGFFEPRHTYLDLSGKAIQSVKYEPNKITINCFKELTGTKRVVLKSNSTKQLYIISKKIDFISRRSKRVTAI